MIGRSVTEIGDNAFSGCDSLARIYSLNPQPPTYATGFETKLYVDTYLYVLPGTLNAYQEAAPWKNFFLLQELGQTVFEVDGVFYGIVPCYEHECWVVAGNTEYTGEVVIPNQVEHDGKTLNVVAIKDNAFQGCESLNTLTIEDGAEELQWNCYSTSSDGRPFSGTSLETLYLGRNLVNDSLFSFIESLKDVTIGNSVERISNYAFYGCTGLTEITIPNSVTEIGHESFYGCTNLTKITISNSVTEIGYRTFAGCSNLKTIYSLNLQPPTYDIFPDPAFEQTCYSSAVLYVPIGSLNAYQTTIPWSNFENIQEFDPVTGIDNTKMEVEAENEETTIYDLQGRRLSRSQRGINIINGKKVLVTSHK